MLPSKLSEKYQNRNVDKSSVVETDRKPQFGLKRPHDGTDESADESDVEDVHSDEPLKETFDESRSHDVGEENSMTHGHPKTFRPNPRTSSMGDDGPPNDNQDVSGKYLQSCMFRILESV